LGKSAPSTPAVPSATETAQAQSTSNAATAADTAALQNVDQYSPYGSTTYNQNGSYTDPSGNTVPTYAQTTSLSPMGQNILSGEQGVSSTLVPTAENLATQAQTATTNPLNFNTADSGILNAAPQQLNNQAAGAVFNEEAGFLAPQWGQQQQQLQDQLSRQGISVGSGAYDNAETQFDNAQTQAYQSAADSATAQGAQSAQSLFGLAQAGQNQNIQQQQLAQQQPLSLLSELYGATPATPTQPISTPATTSVSPTDVVGATASANNAAQSEYQAQLAQQNATTGSVGGLLGTGAMAGAIYF
jgi:hypothetical protein